MPRSDAAAPSARLTRFNRVYRDATPDDPRDLIRWRREWLSTRAGRPPLIEQPLPHRSPDASGDTSRFGYPFLEDDHRTADGRRDESDPTLIANSIIRDHVEAISELWIPGRSQRRLERSGPTAIVPYGEFERVYWDQSADEPPMTLIVHIADECGQLVADLCQRPRVLLQRQRERQSLDRIQQVDDACIRWLAQAPGRTIAEKAGPEQRVLGVVRRPTTNTLENRVLRDFLVRAERACRVYCDRHKAWRGRSARYSIVARFAAKASALLRRSEIGRLAPIIGLVVPNYVLQFDERYSILWTWYDRLRRQQQEAESVMLWQHRVWAERVCLAGLKALSGLADHRLDGELLIGRGHICGCHVDPASSFASWIIGSASGPLRIDAISREMLTDPAAGQSGLVPLQPDTVLALRSAFSNDVVSLLAVWSCFGRGTSTRDGLARELADVIGSAPAGANLHGLLVVADPGAEGSASVHATERGALVTVHDAGADLPRRLVGAIDRWLQGALR
jgi:hypothetical protein